MMRLFSLFRLRPKVREVSAVRWLLESRKAEPVESPAGRMIDANAEALERARQAEMTRRRTRAVVRRFKIGGGR